MMLEAVVAAGDAAALDDGAAPGGAPPGVPDLMAALAGVPDSSRVRLQELEERRRAVQRERAQVRAQQVSEDRKRQRLLDRLRGVNTEDLLGIVAARFVAPQAKGKAVAKGKAKGKGKGKAKAPAEAADAAAAPIAAAPAPVAAAADDRGPLLAAADAAEVPADP